jgi:hypothetical protein
VTTTQSMLSSSMSIASPCQSADTRARPSLNQQYPYFSHIVLQKHKWRQPEASGEQCETPLETGLVGSPTRKALKVMGNVSSICCLFSCRGRDMASENLNGQNGREAAYESPLSTLRSVVTIRPVFTDSFLNKSRCAHQQEGVEMDVRLQPRVGFDHVIPLEASEVGTRTGTNLHTHHSYSQRKHSCLS